MRANDTKIISVTDLPAYEDEFDIKHYINGLANFIKSCETPLTIAIQGEWGSGKTSIMNMVREQLDHTKNFLEIIYVFLTIFLYLLKCPQSLIL